MHMICPFMPIPALTELTEFLYISCRKNYRTRFRCHPSAGARGHTPLCAPTRRYCRCMSIALTNIMF